MVRAYRGERAEAGLPSSGRAAALSADHLRQMSGALNKLNKKEVPRLRDQVLLVLGWASNRRRHTLLARNIADIALVEQGLDVDVRKGKTGQAAEGKAAALPYGSHPLTCPVRITLA